MTARFNFSGTFTDQNGSVVSGGTCIMYLANSTTAATMYSSETSSAVASVTSGTDGTFAIWLDPTDYDPHQRFKLALSKTGFTTQNTDYIEVFPKVVDAMDFGATGDGVTDDTLKIQSAIDWCQANDSNLYFPTGRYIVSSLTIEVSATAGTRLGIKGDGPQLTVFVNNASAEPIFVIDGEYDAVATLGNGPILFENFTLYGTAITASRYGIHIRDCSDLILRNIRFIAFDIGVYAQGIHRSVFEKCYFAENNYGFKTAIPFTSSSYGNNWNVFRDCTFDHNAVQAVFYNQGTAILFDNCFWIDNGIQSTGVAIGDGTGAHDGLANAATLTNTTAGWLVDNFIGYVLHNETDGSYGTITDNDGTTMTAVLAGGTDNDWDIGDVYRIDNRSGSLYVEQDATATYATSQCIVTLRNCLFELCRGKTWEFKLVGFNNAGTTASKVGVSIYDTRVANWSLPVDYGQCDFINCSRVFMQNFDYETAGYDSGKVVRITRQSNGGKASTDFPITRVAMINCDVPDNNLAAGLGLQMDAAIKGRAFLLNVDDLGDIESYEVTSHGMQSDLAINRGHKIDFFAVAGTDGVGLERSEDEGRLDCDQAFGVDGNFMNKEDYNADQGKLNFFSTILGGDLSTYRGTGKDHIRAATAANPVVLTINKHDFRNGDQILVEDVVGMTDINDITFIAGDVANSTAALYTDAANPGATTITAITNANPAVVTCSTHGLANADMVLLAGAIGITEVNKTIATLANKTADTFEISGVNSTNFGVYQSGGTLDKLTTVDGTGYDAYTSGGTARCRGGHHIYTDTRGRLRYSEGAPIERQGDDIRVFKHVGGFQTFGSTDTTPSVRFGDQYFTAGTPNISNFDDGYQGQEITVIFRTAAVILVAGGTGAAIYGNGAADFTGAIGDHMRCTYDGKFWHCAIHNDST